MASKREQLHMTPNNNQRAGELILYKCFSEPVVMKSITSLGTDFETFSKAAGIIWPKIQGVTLQTLQGSVTKRRVIDITFELNETSCNYKTVPSITGDPSDFTAFLFVCVPASSVTTTLKFLLKYQETPLQVGGTKVKAVLTITDDVGGVLGMFYLGASE